MGTRVHKEHLSGQPSAAYQRECEEHSFQSPRPRPRLVRAAARWERQARNLPPANRTPVRVPLPGRDCDVSVSYRLSRDGGAVAEVAMKQILATSRSSNDITAAASERACIGEEEISETRCSKACMSLLQEAEERASPATTDPNHLGERRHDVVLIE